MRVLLTGATGFLGFRTLEQLVDCQNITEIIATGRTLSSNRTIEHPKLTYALCSLEDYFFVESITKNVDVIINTASYSSPWGKEFEFIRSNCLTQNNLINAAKKFSIQRFIYISSPSIYYNGSSRFLVNEQEALPEKFVNNYAKTKFEAEQLLVKSNLNYVILRPRALIGRGDTIIMPRIIKAYNSGKLKIIGDGNNKVDLTSVSNVVDAIILSISAKEDALNNVYNITNDEPVFLWESIDYVLQKIGKPPINKSVSAKTAFLFAAFLEFKSKLTHYKEPVLTKYGVGTLAYSFTLDIQKAKTKLGYFPKQNTQQAMDEFINWYVENETV